MSESTTEETVVKPDQTRVTPELGLRTLQAIMDAGEGGATLKTLSAITGVRYRTMSNVCWYLEGRPEPSRAKDTFGVPRFPQERLVERVEGRGATFRVI